MTLHGIPGEGSGDTYWPAEVWDGRRGLLAECAEAVCVVALCSARYKIKDTSSLYVSRH